MNEIEQGLKEIRRLLDQVDMELQMNAEAIESIEMSLKFLMLEMDYEFWGDSSAG